MTKTILLAAVAAVFATASPAAFAASGEAGLSGRHDRVLMRRKTIRRSARSGSMGTGIVTGGKPTATGGTPGGMPDRQ